MSYSVSGYTAIMGFLLPQIFMSGISIIIALAIVKRRGLSKGFAFLGIFGIFGIFILAFIQPKGSAGGNQNYNNSYNTGNMGNPNVYNHQNQYPYGNQGNFNANSTYGNPGSFNANSIYGNQGSFNATQSDFNVNTTGTDDLTYGNDETVMSGVNYEFEGSMNVCGTHNGAEETYDSVYEDYINSNFEKSYNLNGENIKYDKNICPHCGAKVRLFASHCEECGGRL